MNINASYIFCQTMARQEGYEGHFSPSQFNAWALFALGSAIAQRLPLIDVDPEAYEMLLPLLQVVKGLELEDGTITVPAPRLEIHSLFTSEGRKIERLRPDQFHNRRHDALTGPERKYPIGMLIGDKVEILPDDVGPVALYYFRKPKEPRWAYQPGPGESLIYDSQHSQDFEVNDRLHEEICVRILQYAGISLSNDTLAQYGLTRERK